MLLQQVSRLARTQLAQHQPHRPLWLLLLSPTQQVQGCLPCAQSCCRVPSTGGTRKKVVKKMARFWMKSCSSSLPFS